MGRVEIVVEVDEFREEILGLLGGAVLSSTWKQFWELWTFKYQQVDRIGDLLEDQLYEDLKG